MLALLNASTYYFLAESLPSRCAPWIPVPPQASGRFISGSMTANYNLHRREHAAAVTGRPAQPSGGGIGGIAAVIRVGADPVPAAGSAGSARERDASGSRAAHSSDDRVFQSFRKAEIHRR